MWDDLERFLIRCDQLRRFLSVAEEIQNAGTYGWAQASAEARATTLISLMAELEALVNAILHYVNAEITGFCVDERDLSPCLRALAVGSTFQALSDIKDPDKVWSYRLAVAMVHISEKQAVLPSADPRHRTPIPPLDGRTLKPTHFERVALIYGINLASLFSTSEKLSLVRVSGARNDIAHGNLPFGLMFSRAKFEIKHVRDDVDNLESIAFRFVEAFDKYLRDKEYLSSAV